MLPKIALKEPTPNMAIPVIMIAKIKAQLEIVFLRRGILLSSLSLLLSSSLFFFHSFSLPFPAHLPALFPST